MDQLHIPDRVRPLLGDIVIDEDRAKRMIDVRRKGFKTCRSLSLCCCLFCTVFPPLLTWYCSKAFVLKITYDPLLGDTSREVTPDVFPQYMGCGSSPKKNKCMSTGDQWKTKTPKTDAEMDECGRGCYSLEMVKHWQALTKRLPWKNVTFTSRPGPDGQATVPKLAAWWLPGDTSNPLAPRVIAMPGKGCNNNHCGGQAMCYLLRSMGFSCLLPSPRDTGYSGQSDHPGMDTWGWDLPFDLLGAWDYAVNDPDGLLGGALPPDQVGIMGFSKGAWTASIAFGLDENIPAAWLDSGPFTGLGGILRNYIEDYAIPEKDNPFRDYTNSMLVWWMDYLSNTTNGMYYPTKTLNNRTRLKCRKEPRPVMVAHDQEDSFVDVENGQKAAMFFSGLPQCYALSTFMPYGKCAGDAHHVHIWTATDETRRQLCKFWTNAFKKDQSMCGLEKLPSFIQMVDTNSPTERAGFDWHWSFYPLWLLFLTMLCWCLVTVCYCASYNPILARLEKCSGYKPIAWADKAKTEN